jgi:hypothetical protein
MGPYRTIAGRMTRAQSDMLLEHIDGSRWVDAPVKADFMMPTRRGLMCLGLIEYRVKGSSAFPKFTYITEKGRHVLAQVLSNYADALIAAGYDVTQRRPCGPIELENTIHPHDLISASTSDGNSTLSHALP